MMNTISGKQKGGTRHATNRRACLKAGITATAALSFSQINHAKEPAPKILKGRIRQSVVSWCFKPMTVEELAGHATELGLTSVELVQPEHFPILQKAGLTCAIASSHGFAKGFAHKEEHEDCLKILRTNIEAAARFNVPSVITFSGFRCGLSNEEGTKNMIDGLKKIVGFAEEKKSRFAWRCSTRA